MEGSPVASPVINTATNRTSQSDLQVPLLLFEFGGEDRCFCRRQSAPRRQRQLILSDSPLLSDNPGVNQTSTIEITINGEPRELAAESSVTDLVSLLELAAGRLAIELNLSILPRAVWAETKLQDGDKLEIVHFVGGG